jgi:hypothetical protein
MQWNNLENELEIHCQQYLSLLFNSLGYGCEGRGNTQAHWVTGLDSARDGSNGRIYSWLLCSSYDAFGNCTQFDYNSEDSVGVTGQDMPLWEGN